MYLYAFTSPLNYQMNQLACSPELNPIRFFWNILQWCIHHRSIAQQTVQELSDVLIQVWGEASEAVWCLT